MPVSDTATIGMVSKFRVAAMVLLGTAMGFRGEEMCFGMKFCTQTYCMTRPTAAQQCTGDDLMDAKPSLLALTPVVRSLPVPMQPVTW